MAEYDVQYACYQGSWKFRNGLHWQKIYIAGGVQDSNANDATDRLLEYDTVTGLWTELATCLKAFAFPLVEYHGPSMHLEVFKDRIRGVRNPYSTQRGLRSINQYMDTIAQHVLPSIRHGGISSQ